MAGLTRRALFSSFFGGGAAVRRKGKTLVTVFLRGGADGLNMVVPYADPDYARLRPSLAITRPGEGDGSCLDLDGFFGLHPAFAPLMPQHEAGRLAVVHAVGSDDETRSHFEAQDQMEHGAAFGQRVGGGWIGRYLRARGGAGNLSAVAVGTQVPEALRGAPSVAAMTSLTDLEIRGADGAEDEVAEALAALYAGQGNLSKAGRDTIELMGRARDLSGEDEESGVEYPDGGFAAGLRDIARLVKADLGLQVASLDLGAWDTHFFQGSLFAGRIEELAGALAAFQEDLGERRSEVVVLVMTEFGRRAYENASFGTDHGRGGAMLVLGDGLRTEKVHGRWPGLKDGQLVGPGDLAVTTDYRSVLSEILGAAGDVDGREVFPDFTPAPLGLVA